MVALGVGEASASIMDAYYLNNDDNAIYVDSIDTIADIGAPIIQFFCF